MIKYLFERELSEEWRMLGWEKMKAYLLLKKGSYFAIVYRYLIHPRSICHHRFCMCEMWPSTLNVWIFNFKEMLVVQPLEFPRLFIWNNGKQTSGFSLLRDAFPGGFTGSPPEIPHTNVHIMTLHHLAWTFMLKKEDLSSCKILIPRVSPLLRPRRLMLFLSLNSTKKRNMTLRMTFKFFSVLKHNYPE